MSNPFRKAAKEARANGEYDLARRITTEGRICHHIVKTALDMGCSISLNDGEEWVLEASTHLPTIIRDMFSTDEDILAIRFSDTQQITIWLVYGNGGNDVISNHTVGPWAEAFMAPINQFAETA